MKNRAYKCLVIIFFISTISSCITNKQKRYLQDEGNKKEYKMVEFEEYHLRVNDEISYYLMSSNVGTQYLYNPGQLQSGVSNSVNNYRIYEDGCVVLPTIGRVKISGLTVRESERAISDEFKKVAPDAEVKIALINNYFYVQGDNGKGQYFLYKEKLTIYQALAMAGDISSIGDKKHIKIIRKGVDGIDEIKTFDVRKESVIESEYYYVRPNDVIYIPTNPNSFFRVESVSSFISLFVAPLSLLVLTLSLIK